MYLSNAVEAHKIGDLKAASALYDKALQNQEHNEILFQNYGALKRELGQEKESREIYEIGLKKFPKSKKILSNYANLLRSTSPVKAFRIYLNILRLDLLNDEGLEPKAFINVIEVLENLKFYTLAYSFCISALKYHQNPAALLALLRISSKASFSFLPSSDLNSLASLSEHNISCFTPIEKAEFFFAVAWLNLDNNDVTASRINLQKANMHLSFIFSTPSEYPQEDVEKAITLRNTYSWNMSCLMLPQQEFSDGWSLFEFGLVAPAKGKQKWQRALLKPFSENQLKLWRGECLSGKKLLLLEEQAIGDVMQFLTLLPYLIEEAQHICLLLNPRLIPIYTRSLSDFIHEGKVSLKTYKHVFNGTMHFSMYDYQSPIGSICQHRFTDIRKYGCSGLQLAADPDNTISLRKRYHEFGGIQCDKLVGVSWRGGGRADRIKQKSLNSELFASLLLDNPGIRFVSLQYGESRDTVKEWRKQGVDIVYDEEVDPLKDMNLWLSQVASCDAVISVANTTIHGAGGLNIPTMCLLSQHSDWRWLKDPKVTTSYWYSSVGIARQDKNLCWDTAFQRVKEWLSEGAALPQGQARLE